ncbi:hypothetical protein D9M69_618770 [compost metagenome]
MEHHMPRRVARAVAHVERAVADLHGVAIGEPARGREGASGREAEHLALLRQAVDPELVAGVRADDGQRQAPGQFGRATGVVDVGVGEPDRLERHAQAPGFGFDAVQVATGVDDGGVQGLVTPDDGAVLRERGDGNGEVLQHGHGPEGGPDYRWPDASAAPLRSRAAASLSA